MTAAPTAPPTTASSKGVRLGNVPTRTGRRIGIYGTGGVGKTSLATLLPNAVFFDLDNSLPDLPLKTRKKVQVVEGITSWQEMISALKSNAFDGKGSIVIDSLTVAEEMAAKYIVETVPAKEKGKVITTIDDYGWGFGQQHLYDAFLSLLCILDRHVIAGRNVVLIMHCCVTEAPNPGGEPFIRYEPRLQSPKKGKASTRHRVKEWLGDLFFIGYDVNVEKGRADGAGTATIYPAELPHCWAKCRNDAIKSAGPFQFIKDDYDLWNILFKKEEK